jgi:hypothetical protein
LNSLLVKILRKNSLVVEVFLVPLDRLAGLQCGQHVLEDCDER